MSRNDFKERMQFLKSYREQNPGKGYWDWKQIPAFEEGTDETEQKLNQNEYQFVNNYISQQLEQIRNLAFQNSVNRTEPEPALVQVRWNFETEQQFNQRKQRTIDDLNNQIHRYENPGPLVRVCLYNEELSQLYDLLEQVQSQQYNPFRYEYGLNCIATATSNYGKKYKQLSNALFQQQSPSKRGFTQIPMDQAAAGDIVIMNNDSGIKHGMIYSDTDEQGYRRYNYSDGGMGETSYIHRGRYPAREDQLNAYRFTGTHNDSVQWTADAMEQYRNMKVPSYVFGTDQSDNTLELQNEDPLVQRSDNTQVYRVEPIMPIKSSYPQLNNWERQNAQITQGGQVPQFVQEERYAQAQKAYEQQQQQKREEKRDKVVSGLLQTSRPSTWVAPAVQSVTGSGSYMDNFNGEGFDNEVVNTAVDIATPFVFNKAASAARNIATGLNNTPNFIFQHLPYKTIFDTQTKLRNFGNDAIAFFRTPLDENPIQTVRDRWARRQLQKDIATKVRSDIVFDNPVYFPGVVKKGSYQNFSDPIPQIRERLAQRMQKHDYRYSFPNNGYTLYMEPEMYDPNYLINSIPVKNYLSMKDVWNMYDGENFFTRVFRTPGRYFSYNMNPGFNFYNNKQNFIKMNPKALKDYGFDYSTVLSHEYNHALSQHDELSREISLRDFREEAFNFNQLPRGVRNYLNMPTEIQARGTQLKNYFNTNKLTPDMLKYAAIHYVEDTGMNNNMLQFFSGIEDWRKAAEYLTHTALSNGGEVPSYENGNIEPDKESQQPPYDTKMGVVPIPQLPLPGYPFNPLDITGISGTPPEIPEYDPVSATNQLISKYRGDVLNTLNNNGSKNLYRDYTKYVRDRVAKGDPRITSEGFIQEYNWAKNNLGYNSPEAKKKRKEQEEQLRKRQKEIEKRANENSSKISDVMSTVQQNNEGLGEGMGKVAKQLQEEAREKYQKRADELKLGLKSAWTAAGLMANAASIASFYRNAESIASKNLMNYTKLGGYHDLIDTGIEAMIPLFDENADIDTKQIAWNCFSSLINFGASRAQLPDWVTNLKFDDPRFKNMEWIKRTFLPTVIGIAGNIADSTVDVKNYSDDLKEN